MAVLLENLLCFLVRVERVHQNEWDVTIVLTIELLDEESSVPVAKEYVRVVPRVAGWSNREMSDHCEPI